MSITSFSFLAFISITVVFYHLVPGGRQWLVLLAASVLFYISFSPAGILVLIITAWLSYLAALRIQRVKDEQCRWLEENKRTADRTVRKARKEAFQKRIRRYVVLTVILNIGLLFLCKYYGPLAVQINTVFNTRIWTAEYILLPLGISYYSLQLIGYVTDVSRDLIPAEKNPLKVILYASFFLSIMQGPFNRYGQLMPQICRSERVKCKYQQMKFAVLRIVWGYIKKLCIADQAALVVNEIFANYDNYAGVGIFLAFVALLCSSMRIFPVTWISFWGLENCLGSSCRRIFDSPSSQEICLSSGRDGILRLAHG